MDYFESKGIPIDSSTSLEEVSALSENVRKAAEARVPESHSNRESFRFKKYLTRDEGLVRSYAESWNRHPETKPAMFHHLETILAQDGPVDCRRVKQLERELPAGEGKLLFTLGEVARDTLRFYHRLLRDPLKADVENGKVGKELGRYFTIEEIDQLPDIRKVGLEEVVKTASVIAAQVLEALDALSVLDLTAEMKELVGEHGNIDHRFKTEKALNGKAMSRCEHSRRYVKLSVHFDKAANRSRFIFVPSRGSNLIEEGWYEIQFPIYYMFR